MDRTVPTGAALLLDFIGDIEAPRGYDTIYGNNQGKLPKPVTAMTVDEVISAQPGWSKRFGSSATGRYQFMNATLKDLKAELGLRGSQLLDANLQDRLAYHLLKRRGYDAFAAGRLSVAEFGKRLAQEWASLPVLADTKGAHRHLSRGQSYYAGDGLNKSLVKPEKVEGMLSAALVLIEAGDAPPAPGASLPDLKPLGPLPPAEIPPPPDVEAIPTSTLPEREGGGVPWGWVLFWVMLAAFAVWAVVTLMQPPPLPV